MSQGNSEDEAARRSIDVANTAADPSEIIALAANLMLWSAIFSALLVGSAIRYAGWIPQNDVLNESTFLWPYLCGLGLIFMSKDFLHLRAMLLQDDASMKVYKYSIFLARFFFATCAAIGAIVFFRWLRKIDGSAAILTYSSLLLLSTFFLSLLARLAQTKLTGSPRLPPLEILAIATRDAIDFLMAALVAVIFGMSSIFFFGVAADFGVHIEPVRELIRHKLPVFIASAAILFLAATMIFHIIRRAMSRDSGEHLYFSTTAVVLGLMMFFVKMIVMVALRFA